MASPTEAMHDVYDRLGDDLAQARVDLAARPGQVGAAVYIAGRWAGLEMLAAASIFARAWPRLVTGRRGRDRPRRRQPPEPRPRECARAGRPAAVEPAPAVGLGAEYRVDGKVLGAALVAEERVAHLAAFPA